MAEATYHVSVRESAAGASKRHLALFNASGSGKTLKVYRVQAAPSPTAAVTGQQLSLSVVRITAAPTGGSSATINKALSSSTNAPAQVTATAAATGGATEEASAFGLATVSGEETASAVAQDLYSFQIDGTQPVTCAEGEGILVKQGALAGAGAVSVAITFTLV